MRKIIFYIFMNLASLSQAQTFSGGSGTVDDPYKIGTVLDLIELSAIDEIAADTLWDKHYILISDIDFGEDEKLVDWNNDGVVDWENSTDSLGFSPIGDNPPENINQAYIGERQRVFFKGTFNGAGYVIKNLYIKREERYLGLFGSVRSAKISYIGIDNAHVEGEGIWGGGILVGRSQWDSQVSNVYVTNSFLDISRWFSGAIVGYERSGFISNCYVDSVTIMDGDYEQGVLLGDATYTEVSNCYAVGSVASSSAVKGMFGDVFGADIENCYWDTITSGQNISASGNPLHTSQFRYKSTFNSWDFENVWHLGVTDFDNVIRPRLRWQDFDPVYCVSYNGNGSEGGTVPIDSIGPYYPNEFHLIREYGDLVKKGYKLLYWNTNSDGSGTDYFPRNGIKITSDTTLYAIWKIDDEVVLSSENFEIIARSPTCNSFSDGEVVIKNEILDIDIDFNGKEYALAAEDSITIDGLVPDTYEMTILIDSLETRTFTIVVPEMPEITSKVKVQGSSVLFSIEGGIAPYTINIDGNEYETYSGSITINNLESGEYNAIIKDNSSCNDNKELNFTIEEIKIYPNPIVGDKLNIFVPFTYFDQKYKVKITSLDGRVCISQIINSTGDKIEVDISELASGCYILHVDNKTVKFIK